MASIIKLIQPSSSTSCSKHIPKLASSMKHRKNSITSFIQDLVFVVHGHQPLGDWRILVNVWRLRQLRPSNVNQYKSSNSTQLAQLLADAIRIHRVNVVDDMSLCVQICFNVDDVRPKVDRSMVSH